MAKYTIEDTTLTSIADAIRAKGNTTESLTPTQMPDAINAIEAGSKGITNFLSRSGGGYKPTAVDAYTNGTRTYYGTTSSAYVTNYYWYRSSNTNVYWQAAKWDNSLFVAGHKYRVAFWIWHNGDVNNEPIAFHQNNIFINEHISVENPLTEITTEPQLISFELEWQSSTTYHFGLWLYPVDSSNQVRLTPVVIEDLTTPATNYPPMPI